MGWWIAGGVAAVGVVYYSYKHAQVAAVAPVATDPNADPNAQMYGDPNAYAYGDSSGVAYSGYQGTTPVQTTNTITVKADHVVTNAEWYTHAVRSLLGHGYTHHAVVVALTNYLLGVPLTSGQIGIVEAAVHRIGPPPHPPTIHHAVTKRKR